MPVVLAVSFSRTAAGICGDLVLALRKPGEGRKLIVTVEVSACFKMLEADGIAGTDQIAVAINLTLIVRRLHEPEVTLVLFCTATHDMLVRCIFMHVSPIQCSEPSSCRSVPQSDDHPVDDRQTGRHLVSLLAASAYGARAFRSGPVAPDSNFRTIVFQGSSRAYPGASSQKIDALPPLSLPPVTMPRLLPQAGQCRSP